ncbi:hypothetical protein BDZ97DRAFT_1811391 [Flammula alnicola]|nr:hypothetical protein BDZ97DRAFT_1811391 [Flammula alnicola]
MLHILGADLMIVDDLDFVYVLAAGASEYLFRQVLTSVIPPPNLIVHHDLFIMFFKLLCTLSLLSTVIVASTVPSVKQRDAWSFGPLSNASALGPDLQNVARKMTNAERLAAGFPLKPPRRRASKTGAYKAVPSGGAFLRGYLEAFDSQDGTSLGFVSNEFDDFGLAQLVSAEDERTPMLFSIPADMVGPFNIEIINGPDSSKFPFFGGIEGFAFQNADIGPMSPNYITLGGTEETDPGSSPISGENSFTAATGIPSQIESSIWTFTPKSNGLTTRWINSDLSTPTTFLGYITIGSESESALFFTGDPEEFSETFSDDATTIQWISLEFVQVPT